MVFSTAAMLEAFEAATGIRLHAGPREALRFKLVRRRLGLPRVDSFDSTVDGAISSYNATQSSSSSGGGGGGFSGGGGGGGGGGGSW
jgi:uncharacterized membrane protein YgcG